ncbi:AMP-binding protein [Amycolatopsis sp. NPDC006131]|uniref:class I adenylate-forming enzyme family protein n=1 Tax=Amycolatopsis sp. NPDC006131 TaxID=3156731 RepID=UPI0033B75A8B
MTDSGLDGPPMLHRYLRTASDESGDQVALTFQGRDFTYREIEDRANAVAHRLVAAGLGPHRRGMVVVSNRPEWMICTQAVLKTGAAVVTPLATWTAYELGHALEVSRPDVIVAEASSARTLGARPPGSGTLLCVDEPSPAGWTSIRDVVDQRLDDAMGVVVNPDDDAFLFFSSGTTGLPKAVRHSHSSMSAVVAQWTRQAGLTAADRVQFFMPAPTIFGMATTLACFAARARMSFFQRFHLDTMLRDIQANEITIGMAAAPVAVAMAAHPELERFDLSSLRYLIWGATPIITDVAETVTRRSGVRWLHVYGTSEHGQLASNPVHEPHRWRLDSPGTMSPDGEYRFLDETGAEVPPHTPGELWVKSPQTMTGYLPESADADVFDGAWVRTGDIAYLDRDGFLHIVDRAKEMIKVAGFAVSPVEVERTLFAHPDVDDCAVFAVADGRNGQRPAAAVVPRAGSVVTPQELIEWAAERVSSYKRLADVVFVAAIPRSAAGKVLRKHLPEVVSTALAATSGRTDA